MRAQDAGTRGCAKCGDARHAADGCERQFVSFSVAKESLPPMGDVHTFMQSRNILIGADWSRQEIIKKLRAAERIEVTGEAAQSMGHGLAINDDGRMLFIATAQRTDVASRVEGTTDPQQDSRRP